MGLTDHEVEAAEKRMAALRDDGFALSARYDRPTAQVVVELNTGLTIAFPARLAEGLDGAAPEDLADIEVSPAGLGLHWPKLDADLYLPALLKGAFGSPSFMAAALGAAGGKARSRVKAAAARENGRKGGRPRKAQPDGEPEIDDAKATLKPAVPPKKSITTDYIICLEDGKKFKSLKRHLRTQYNLSPEEYRERWGLPPDYPMVAPAYAKERSALAKKMGVGQQQRKRRA